MTAEDQISTHHHPIDRKILEAARRLFPELSTEHCRRKDDGVCEVTGERCELFGCPKVLNRI